MFLSLALASVLAGSATQQINCFPKDDDQSTDRVVISLAVPGGYDLPSQGTLLLSSGISDEGDEENSGVMKLLHVPETDAEASQGLVRYQARNTSSIFYVLIAEKNIGKTLKDFELSLDLERVSDHTKSSEDLTCYATLFSNE